jgi:hypothetical protein
MADSRWHEVADRIDDWIAAIDRAEMPGFRH